ncbi:MAG: hypothetical protein P8170_06470, partial [Gemmatimonadota bacterium]
TEPVVDLDSLVPDEAATEPVVDLDSLVPDETAGEPVVDLGGLAPEQVDAEEESDDLETASPDEAAPEEADLDALGPDEAAELLADLAGLFPDIDAGKRGVDLSAPAPEKISAAEEEQVVEVEEAPEPSLADDAATAEGLPSDELEDEPLVTRTMAELYAQQGLVDRALEVFSELLRAAPDDEELSERVRQLEAVSGEAKPRHPAPESAQGETEPEDHLWQSEPSDDAAGVDTPFAWTEDEAEELAEGPGISTYFDRILSWRSEKLDGGSDGQGET